MCHLSLKFSDKSDPNPMYTFDKIVAKHISEKETLLKQHHSIQKNNKQGNKNIPPLCKQNKNPLNNCGASDESIRL